MADDPDTTDPVAALPAALAYTLRGDQGVKNSALADKYLTERRGRSAKYAADYEDVMSQRQAEVENAKRILDQAAEAMRAGHTGAGLWQMNLPMLQMAAGFFKPTKTGNFGEELGNALTGLGAGVAHQRMSNTEFEKGMADLTMKRSTLAQEPLKDKAALLKAQQLAEEQGVRSIETAQVRTANGAGAGSTPAKMKMFEEWKKTNPNGSFTDFLVWESKLGSDKNSPASLREFNAAKESNPALKDMTYDQWVEMKARAAAAGRETGTEQVKSAQALPGVLATAEQLLETVDRARKHPGLSASLGWGAYVPNKPGGPGADFQAILQQLKGQAFLKMFDALRGAGAITEMEGAKATDALAALPLTQSEKQFKEQLDLIDRIVKKGIETARQKAPGAPAPKAPTAGGLVKGDDGVYRFTPGGQ